MGPRWISLLLFFSGCKVSLRFIPFSEGAAFRSISICAAFSYILYIAALHCCVLYRASDYQVGETHDEIVALGAEISPKKEPREKWSLPKKKKKKFFFFF